MLEMNIWQYFRPEVQCNYLVPDQSGAGAERHSQVDNIYQELLTENYLLWFPEGSGRIIVKIYNNKLVTSTLHPGLTPLHPDIELYYVATVCSLVLVLDKPLDQWAINPSDLQRAATD